MKATVKATAGLARMAAAVLRTWSQLTTSAPPAARPAPTSPPIRACEEDDGMPNHQVK